MRAGHRKEELLVIAKEFGNCNEDWVRLAQVFHINWRRNIVAVTIPHSLKKLILHLAQDGINGVIIPVKCRPGNTRFKCEVNCSNFIGIHCQHECKQGISQPQLCLINI